MDANHADQPPWKRIRLSLEQPYRDDNGDHILQLLDITDDGQPICKPRDEPASRLGDNLVRIISERGVDFFSKYTPDGAWRDAAPVSLPSDGSHGSDTDDDAADATSQKNKSQSTKQKPMNDAELHEMRMEILPHLHVAIGEMSLARDLLALLSDASTADPEHVVGLPPGSLSAATITKAPAIPAVQAFNAQLTVGGKDSALRKASDVLWEASESIERARKHDEAYWISALTARQGNWGLLPAPLPPGAPTGKGADRSARDLAISFGLEEAPPTFKRRALAYLSSGNDDSPLNFPYRQRTRLEIAITTIDRNSAKREAHNTLSIRSGVGINSILHGAQAEIIEQEIFADLIREAGTFPTAETNVSERLIVIEAAEDLELRFEMVPIDFVHDLPAADKSLTALCDLIYSCLHLLLLRAHSGAKAQRATGSTARTSFIPTAILQPVIDLIQYRSFCDRVGLELTKATMSLMRAGVRAKMRLTRVGESGSELIGLLDDVLGKGKIGGEAILRVDNRQTLRLTFQSPSILLAQVSQANVTITSMLQLSDLIKEEVEYCLLERIADIGRRSCGEHKVMWFVDRVSTKAVGRWDGHVVTISLTLQEEYAVAAEALTTRAGYMTSEASHYPMSGQVSFFDWARRVVGGLSTA